jgi:hypothetical protein
MRFVMLLTAAACLSLSGAVAQDAKSPWPATAKVYFINPTDGATVSSPFVVQFGLSGLGVAPAGVEKEKTGHHHLLINTDLPKDLTAAIPADDNHRHFGGGQTEAKLELPAGTHTLQLLVGDHDHVPHSPPLASEKITITVK